MAAPLDRFITDSLLACAKGATLSPVYGACSICSGRETCKRNNKIAIESEFLAKHDFMTLKHLALNSPTPMLACKYGFYEREGYRDCENCLWTQDCEFFQKEVAKNLADDCVEEFIKKPKAEDYQYWLQDKDGHYYFDENLN